MFHVCLNFGVVYGVGVCVNVCVVVCCLFITLLLLYAFRDLWKEGGDSNFQIFSHNCQFHHRRLESLEHFNVLFIYHSKHYGLIFLGVLLFLQGLLLFKKNLCTFPFVRKYTLHVCYIFNAIDGFF